MTTLLLEIEKPLSVYVGGTCEESFKRNFPYRHKKETYFEIMKQLTLVPFEKWNSELDYHMALLDFQEKGYHPYGGFLLTSMRSYGVSSIPDKFKFIPGEDGYGGFSPVLLFMGTQLNSREPITRLTIPSYSYRGSSLGFEDYSWRSPKKRKWVITERGELDYSFLYVPCFPVM